MTRWSRLLLLIPLGLSACTNLQGLLPFPARTVTLGGHLSEAVEASIVRARETDDEYLQDPWSFVLILRNKTHTPLALTYKTVFTTAKGEPTDVIYGDVDLDADAEYRKGLAPQVESAQARVVLYARTPAMPVPSVGPATTSPPVAMPSPVPTQEPS